MVQVSVGETRLTALVDTGAERSLVCADDLPATERRYLERHVGSLVAVDGNPLTVEGIAPISLTIGSRVFHHEFIVVHHIHHPIILGQDFLAKHDAVIDCTRGELTLLEDQVAVPLQARTQAPRATRVVMGVRTTLQPRSECHVMAALIDKGGLNEQAPGMLCPREDKLAHKGLLMAHVVAVPRNRKVPISIINAGETVITLPADFHIADFQPVEVIQTVDSAAPTTKRSPPVLHHLTAPQQRQAEALLSEFADVMMQPGRPLGRTTLVRHHINVGDASPVKQRWRRIPPHKHSVVDGAINEMLEDGIIRPSHSAWSSPIVLVRKGDGYRFCVDYRALNERTFKDAYPLPLISETLDCLGGSAWFTVVDLKSGYWQIELDEESREKTAFASHKGLFEFNVLPFGVCNGPGTFQRLMNAVLAGLTWKSCLVYLDDIIVFSKTFSDHIQRLREVLTRIRGAGLQLSSEKCQWFQREVTYLGHVVSTHGVATDPAKVERVSNWPTPTSVKELRSFLGLATYYRRFVKGFADVAKPLHHLTGKQVPFVWTTQCQTAFDTLRTALVSAPILALPQFETHSAPFILDTDASDVGIGGVLSQADEHGFERVIAYGSRCLSKPERNYCATRREMLALVHFIEEFRPYLLGKEFLLRTDHNALTWLRNFKEPTGQVARWLERLQEYVFDIEYRPGTKHSNADALSRRPLRRHGDCPTCGITDPEPGRINAAMWESGWQLDHLREEQRLDPAIARVRAWLANGHERPTRRELTAYDAEVKAISSMWNDLIVEDDLLCIRSGPNTAPRAILPPPWRSRALQQVHGSPTGGHFGRRKTLASLKSRFWWPGMSNSVSRWVDECGTCATFKGPIPRPVAPLVPLEASAPNERLSIDIVGPLSTTRAGNKYILTMVDNFTKWVEATPLPNHTAPTVAQALVQVWFSRFGTPKQILSDQGSEFDSQVLKQLCNSLGIVKKRSSPYHPQGNGAVERVNRSLKAMLLSYPEEKRDQWDTLIPLCLWAYRAAQHESTGYSPFALTFGREMELPIDAALDRQNHHGMDARGYASWLVENLREIHARANVKLMESRETQKTQYDTRAKGQTTYQVGDMVWMLNSAPQPGLPRKLQTPFRGPFIVEREVGECNYEIRPQDSRRKTMVIHANRLKRCGADTRFIQHPQVSGQNRPRDLPAAAPRVLHDGDVAAYEEVACLANAATLNNPSFPLSYLQTSPTMRAAEDDLSSHLLGGSRLCYNPPEDRERANRVARRAIFEATRRLKRSLHEQAPVSWQSLQQASERLRSWLEEARLPSNSEPSFLWEAAQRRHLEALLQRQAQVNATEAPLRRQNRWDRPTPLPVSLAPLPAPVTPAIPAAPAPARSRHSRRRPRPATQPSAADLTSFMASVTSHLTSLTAAVTQQQRREDPPPPRPQPLTQRAQPDAWRPMVRRDGSASEPPRQPQRRNAPNMDVGPRAKRTAVEVPRGEARTATPWHAIPVDAPIPPATPFSDDEEEGELRENIPPSVEPEPHAVAACATVPVEPSPVYVFGDSNFTDLDFHEDLGAVRPYAARGATLDDVRKLTDRVVFTEKVTRVVLGLGTNPVRSWGRDVELIDDKLRELRRQLTLRFPNAQLLHIPVHVSALHGMRKEQGGLVNRLAAKYFRQLQPLPTRHTRDAGIHYTRDERQAVLSQLQRLAWTPL